MNNILIIGASGIVGNILFRRLLQYFQGEVVGLVRNKNSLDYFSKKERQQLHIVEDVLDKKLLIDIICKLKPNIVINCLGVDVGSTSVSELIRVFGWFPQTLSNFCNLRKIRLIHVSTDGVFSGKHGGYLETDFPDAIDDYGITKMLGENFIWQGDNHLCIRTSFIGPSLRGDRGLLDWFLGSTKPCQGYKDYYFSGISTLEFSRIIAETIIPNKNLCGLYHIGSQRISKFDLLTLIKRIYGTDREVRPISGPRKDLSLIGRKFEKETGTLINNWNQMLYELKEFK